jgi:hypothetical protein
MTPAMPASTRICALLATVLAIGCRDDGASVANSDELSRLPAEVFSHADQASAEDARCLGEDGVLISATSIGPIRLGRKLQMLRHSCDIAMVKVPASVGVNGPVLGVSANGGLILFTVAGRDSAVQTAGTSSPGFRTRNGIGVSSSIRSMPAAARTLCFKHDSAKVIEVLISRRPLKC